MRRAASLLSLLGLLAAPCAFSHNVEARYVEPLTWHLNHFSKVMAMSYSELGLDFDYSHAAMQTVQGKTCAVGGAAAGPGPSAGSGMRPGALVALQVDRRYAYNIDEPVTLTLTYAPDLTGGPIVIAWDKNGGIGQGHLEIEPEPGAPFRTITVTLDRARFAGLGTAGVDLAIGSASGMALCDVQLTRSFMTPPAESSGRVQLEVKDSTSGRPVPARVGIYDSSGRAPLPSAQALLVERFADKVRLLPVDPRAFWPTSNRQAFYMPGSYDSELPAGTYELAITRGPEYRDYYGTFTVQKGQTTHVAVALKRYADLPAEGWISGDDHIHLARDATRDQTVWTQVAAEDVHVGNLLQMGNISGVYFEQPQWGQLGRFQQDGHALVSGQEDPRTGELGHTIHEDLRSPVHLSRDSYFLYYRVFEESHHQGAVSGYAHLNGGWFNVRRGMALDVPFGLVDFVEVLQAGQLLTNIWYQFLDLGFKLTPSAGSDFPYTDLPGVVREYVKVTPGSSDLDAWYAAFHAGHVYVTNGPFLEFQVNGHQMGDEVRIPAGTQLHLTASARLNPDVDQLDRIELVVEGAVVKTVQALGQDHVALDTTLKADRSMWIAVRAFGKRQSDSNTTVAHSAPIYLIVNGQPFWDKERVPQLVQEQQEVLNGLINTPLRPEEDLEYFATTKLLLEEFPKQLPLLKARIEEVDRKYQSILTQWRQASGASDR
jgi:hypothetical protein